MVQRPFLAFMHAREALLAEEGLEPNEDESRMLQHYLAAMRDKFLERPNEPQG